MTAKRAGKSRTYVEEFRERVELLEQDARYAGTNLTEVCREAGVSRATPDRWKKNPPRTIQLLTLMEEIIAKATAMKNGPGR
jgi:hypothetical protein